MQRAALGCSTPEDRRKTVEQMKAVATRPVEEERRPSEGERALMRKESSLRTQRAKYISCQGRERASTARATMASHVHERAAAMAGAKGKNERKKERERERENYERGKVEEEEGVMEEFPKTLGQKAR